MKLQLAHVETPIGTTALVANDTGLCALDFAPRWDCVARRLSRRYGRVSFVESRDPLGAASALEAYLAGNLSALGEIPVDPCGTAFQLAVWSALRRIPVGSTVSYGELARRLGREGSARAVASANASNPVAIAIPCHRVIGASGALTGYASGLERKRWLLEHEGALGPAPTAGAAPLARAAPSARRRGYSSADRAASAAAQSSRQRPRSR